jgi:hypothetical protein
MPYIPGGGPQRTSNLPAVSDVYHSDNVYVNNVPVALWLSPGTSSAFGGVSLASIPTTTFDDPGYVTSADGLTSSYLANPGAYNNPAAAADGVKANFPGTVDDASTSTGTISSTGTIFSDIVPFLQKAVEEAGRGMWRETGQGGKASNPNITKIWGAIGFPGCNINSPTSNTSPWNTDQTAWCMGFVNFGLLSSGYKYVPTASAAAITQQPQRWNAVQVPKDQAQPGDIAFWSYRHVNFVYEKKGAGFSFVGGNQTPKGGSNNPSDGDVTISYPGGTSASNANWVSCWRPSKT